MEHDPTQPYSPPRDALQRMLRVVLNSLGVAILIFWPLTAITMTVLVLSSTPSSVITGVYLLHVLLGLSALFFLRLAVLGIVLARAPWRLRPKMLNAVARWTSRPQHRGRLYAWEGVWLAVLFGAAAVFFPWPPLPRDPPPSLFVLGAVTLVVVTVAAGPMTWDRMSERRRRRANVSR